MGHCLQDLLLIYHLLCYHVSTFIEQRWNFIFIKFILYGKIDKKKIRKVGKKLDFDPKNKEWCNYSGPVILWFWIEFVTYLHTVNFFSIDFQTMEIRPGGGIHLHTSWIFQIPYHLAYLNKEAILMFVTCFGFEMGVVWEPMIACRISYCTFSGQEQVTFRSSGSFAT